MLNPDQYNALTTSFVGKPLPHCLEENESEEKQKKRYDIFLKQKQELDQKNKEYWKQYYKKERLESEARERAYYEGLRQEKLRWEMAHPGQKHPYNHRAYGDDGRC